MQEDSRLGDLGLLEIFRSTAEHYVGNGKSEYLICPLKHPAGCFIAFVKVFGHPGELGALTWKHICFHGNVLCCLKILTSAPSTSS